MVAAARPRPRAISERPRRRVRLPRWLAVGLALSVVALAVNSIIATTGEGPDPRLAYLDEVRPHVEESTRQGTVLAGLRDNAATLGRTGLRRQLSRLARDAASVGADVRNVEAPKRLADASTLLVAATVARATAVDKMASSLTGALGTGPQEQSVDALVEAGQDLVVADRAYAMFVEALPLHLRDAALPSAWVDDRDIWERPDVAAFVTTLRASASLAPVHDVSLVTVRTDPPAVGRDGDSVVLPNVKSIRVHVVVANVGNEAERRVPVEAVVVSEGGMDVGRQFVDLQPGQRLTVPLELRPSPVGVVTLTVRVALAEGDPTPQENERTLTFVMR